MALHSPLLDDHLRRGAEIIPYGDPTAPDRFAELVETFGPLEIEYAALRKGAALIDRPHRGTIIVRGKDRIDFLNRMITQELKDLAPRRSRRAFWLNRKGRIDADLRVTVLEDHLRFDLDVHSAAHTITTLGSYVFAEDVTFEDAGESLHRLALHGPTSILLLAAVADEAAAVEALRAGDACPARVAGHELLVERDDQAGEIGLEITCAAAAAADVYAALLRAGMPPEGDPHARDPAALSSRVRLRPAGWHAFNIARIEAGTPLFNIDFGPENLPHETGVLRDRVSFKKGCYLGQEVVARMESLGHPKQRLVALRPESPGADLPQPISGAAVFTPAEAAKPCGYVTSSTISPMLGAVPICLAMVRYAQSAAGTELSVEADGGRARFIVQPTLAGYVRAPDATDATLR